MIWLLGEVDRLQDFVDKANRKPDCNDRKGGQGRADEAAQGFRARVMARHFLGDLLPDIFPEGHRSYTTEDSVVPAARANCSASSSSFARAAVSPSSAAMRSGHTASKVFAPKPSKSRTRNSPASSDLSFLISSGSVTSGGMGA